MPECRWQLATGNWLLMTRIALILALLAATATAAPPTTCSQDGPYAKALCAYQHRNFAEAQRYLQAILDSGETDARSIRALYFLARTEMKLGRFEEASLLFIRIYSLDKAFYGAWNCDYLLGECRKATGKA